ncbi:MAG: 4a-hydroxytetrahydrobiopterin dehydratase [Saprospiraceae bacterium]|nr:4a-hydroxytetrahydrobiopterin dehydratase [Saprospiraceae bacterium]
MDWKEEQDYLVKEYEFKDFKEAFAFMTKVALVAEKKDHHPTWGNVYNKVWIKLNTHSAGNKITQKDHDLAAAIDQL